MLKIMTDFKKQAFVSAGKFLNLHHLISLTMKRIFFLCTSTFFSLISFSQSQPDNASYGSDQDKVTKPAPGNFKRPALPINSRINDGNELYTPEEKTPGDTSLYIRSTRGCYLGKFQPINTSIPVYINDSVSIIYTGMQEDAGSLNDEVFQPCIFNSHDMNRKSIKCYPFEKKVIEIPGHLNLQFDPVMNTVLYKEPLSSSGRINDGSELYTPEEKDHPERRHYRPADHLKHLSQDVNEPLNPPSLLVYPNPFSGSATLSYSLARDENVRIALLNVLGEEVILLPVQKRDAGRHELILDARMHGLVAGIYIVRLTVDEQDELIRIIIN
jgi:hypothetical protein